MREEKGTQVFSHFFLRSDPKQHIRIITDKDQLKLSLFDHFIDSLRFWLKGKATKWTLEIVFRLIFPQERFACGKISHLVVAVHFEYMIDHGLKKCPWRRFVVDVYYLPTLPTYRRNQLVLELESRTVDGQ